MGAADPRLRPRRRLPGVRGRELEPGARPDGELHPGRRHVHQPRRGGAHRRRGQQGDRRRAGDGRTLRARQFVASTLDVPQTFDQDGRAGPVARRVPGEGRELQADRRGRCSACTSRCRSRRGYLGRTSTRMSNKALKYNVGCETLEELFALHDEVAEGKVPERVSFGTGHITDFDPTPGAAPGKHTAYAWHVMPFAPGRRPGEHRGGQGGVRRARSSTSGASTRRT